MMNAVHVKGVKHVKHQVAKAAQESARQCQKFGAAFRGIVSVTLMHRRATKRLEGVYGRVAALAANFLNLIRVNQVLAMQMAASTARPYELSHFWLYGSNPFNP